MSSEDTIVVTQNINEKEYGAIFNKVKASAIFSSNMLKRKQEFIELSRSPKEQHAKKFKSELLHGFGIIKKCINDKRNDEFLCKLCNLKFYAEKTCISHLADYHMTDFLIFKCESDSCDFISMCVLSLYQHLQTKEHWLDYCNGKIVKAFYEEYNVMSLNCKLCPKNLTKQCEKDETEHIEKELLTQMKAHISDAHGKNKLRCGVSNCDFVSSSFLLLTHHTQIMHDADFDNKEYRKKQDIILKLQVMLIGLYQSSLISKEVTSSIQSTVIELTKE